MTPELFDTDMDTRHRSYSSAVLQRPLGQVRSRVPIETMPLDHRWLPRFAFLRFYMSFNYVQLYAYRFVCRLAKVGLLPLARLVEGDGSLRFNYNYSLLAALVDRWRPKTHTFHLTVGEMAPTLQDVSYLLGLPLRGNAMGPQDVGLGCRDDLLARFGGVQRLASAPMYMEFPATHTGGPPKWWILQFSMSIMCMHSFSQRLISYS